MYQYLGNTGIHLYEVLNYAALILALIFNLCNFKTKRNMLSKVSLHLIGAGSNKNDKKNKIKYFLVTVLEIVLFTYIQFDLSGSLHVPFGDFVGTGANYFATAFFSPIFIAVFCFFLGLDVFKQMDLITAAYPLRLIIVKLACFCQGCCYGIPCSFGLYNHAEQQLQFPVQLVELGLAALIFVFLILWRKKAEEGTLFPIFLIVYSSTRFFSEFLRREDNVFLGLKKYHFLCLIGIVVGVAQLFIVKKYKEKIKQFYIDYFDAVEDTANDVLIRLGIKRKNEIVHHKNKKKKINTPIQSTQKKMRIANMKKWILIWFLGLIGQIGWNIEGTWFNTFVYEKIDKSPSIISPMLIFSSLAATVSVLLFGTLTDRTGKRRSLISSGFIVWGILTAFFGFVQYIPKYSLVIAIVFLVLGDSFISFFGSMSTDVGFNAWLTDIMNDSNRGQIGGAIAVQSVLGSLLANIIGGMLIGKENNYIRLFIVCGTILSFAGLISIFLFDKKDDVRPNVNGSFVKQFSNLFDFRNIFNHKELVWVSVTVTVFFIGFNTYFPHLGNFLIQYLGYSADKMGIIEAVPMVLAMLATVPVSKYINRNKFIEVTLFSVAFGLIGNYFVFDVTPDDVDTSKFFNLKLFIGIFLVAVGYITMLQATKTWSKNLYPKESRGQYEGIWMISFSFIPMLFGSNIGEWIIKNLGESVLNESTARLEYIPNGKVFLIGAIISGFSIIPIIITKKYVDKSTVKTESKA